MVAHGDSSPQSRPSDGEAPLIPVLYIAHLLSVLCQTLLPWQQIGHEPKEAERLLHPVMRH